MYAEHRYQPRQSRTVSLGAALAINAAVVAGLIFSAPNVIRQVTKTFPIVDYEEPPVPPPIDLPKDPPKTEQKVPQQPRIVTPKPVIDSRSDVVLETTRDIPPVLPPIGKPVEIGPPVAADPPKPAPPLIGARRDPRYAEDFQPQYPASELRAQRDGRVSVRVLVGADGRVKAVEQVSATSAAFFEATRRQALAKWRFRPATRGGVAEESWMTLSVTFRLEDQ